MPEKVQHVMAKPSRYKVLHGGRGSAKSYSFADALVTKTAHFPLRVLCTREKQNSIRDSVHRLLTDRINAHRLDDLFTIHRESIYSQAGAEFIFKGLHQNISDIKSTEGIDICWVEEAEKVSEDSWTILIPTIRKEGSEIWVSFNPEDERSSTYQRFVVHTPPDCRIAEVNYYDNDYFPDVLRREMEYDKAIDFEKYEHVWLGKIKAYAQDCIFKRVRVEDFETPVGPDPTVPDIQFLFGADFGFSVDPTCLIRMFIKDRKLWIDYEAYGHGVDINDLHQFFATVPESNKWKIIADSERPDTISFLAQPHRGRDGAWYEGYNIVGAEKGPGSVEDGIEFLNSFEEIVIHPRCKGAIDNFRNDRWKRDKVTNEILPIPLGKNNHATDACRYALEPYMKRHVTIFDVF
jgi:phage terminase large subunit